MKKKGKKLLKKLGKAVKKKAKKIGKKLRKMLPKFLRKKSKKKKKSHKKKKSKKKKKKSKKKKKRFHIFLQNNRAPSYVKPFDKLRSHVSEFKTALGSLFDLPILKETAWILNCLNRGRHLKIFQNFHTFKKNLALLKRRDRRSNALMVKIICNRARMTKSFKFLTASLKQHNPLVRLQAIGGVLAHLTASMS